MAWNWYHCSRVFISAESVWRGLYKIAIAADKCGCIFHAVNQWQIHISTITHTLKILRDSVVTLIIFKIKTVYCGVHSLKLVVPSPPEQQIYTRRHAQNRNDIVIRGCATVLTSQWIIGLQSEKSNVLLKVNFFQSCVYYATVNVYRMREYPGTTKAMLCSHFVYL